MSEAAPAASLVSPVQRAAAGGGVDPRVMAFVAARAVVVGDLLKYGLCSALALGVDWSTLVGLVTVGVAPLAAAAAGFMLGMASTYAMSIRFVFVDRRQQSVLRETVAFIGVGIAGLGVNQLMLWCLVHSVGLAPGLAKAPTACVVFLFNFVLRRTLVFSGTRA